MNLQIPLKSQIKCRVDMYVVRNLNANTHLLSFLILNIQEILVIGFFLKSNLTRFWCAEYIRSLNTQDALHFLEVTTGYSVAVG